MTDDRRSRAVAQAVIGLGNALGLEVVAEGVETPERADALARMGCLTGQGYLWSPARPPDVITEMLRRAADGVPGAFAVVPAVPLPRTPRIATPARD